MLNQLRSLTKTWVATILVAILVASFGLFWNVSDVFTATGPGVVSVVGRDRISALEYSTEFEREFSRLAEQSDGQITRDMAVQLGMPRAILDRMALRSAINQKTDALGLMASEADVAQAIRENPSFIDPITGQFSRDMFLTLLAQNSITPDQFLNEIRLEMVQAQLSSVMGSGLRPPNTLAETRLRFLAETRDLSVVVIPAATAAEPAAPTPEELAAFYAEREVVYATPPMRAFSFVTLSLEDFVLDAPVDEALLAETYELRRNSLATPEMRDLVEISAPDEDAAREVARRLRAGEDPTAISSDLGLAAPTIHDDAVPTDLLVAALGEAAFSVAEGETTDPVDGGIAWFVARVDQVSPAVEQTLEEARPELQQELASDVAGNMLFDAVDAFELARNQGASLEDASKAASVPEFSYGLVDSTGASDGLPAASQLVRYPDIVRTAFAEPNVGLLSELSPLGEDGYFVLRVDEIVPAATRPLADVEDQVRAQFALAKRAEALDALAETARAGLAAGTTATDAAASLAPGVRGEISMLRRDQATPTLSRELLARAFAGSVGDVVVGAAPDGGRVVVRIDAIRPATEVPAADLGNARELLSNEILDDVALLYQQAVQGEYARRDNEAVLAQAVGVDSLQ